MTFDLLKILYKGSNVVQGLSHEDCDDLFNEDKKQSVVNVFSANLLDDIF